MRTKNLLFAMALPVVFTACTSDEIFEASETGARAQLDNVAVAVENGATTRFAWENNKWAFQAGDKFGAGITDPTAGTVADTYISNYVFEQQASGMYTTTSVMTEGIYQFYSYPGFETKDSRKLIAFDLGEQVCDLENPAENVNNTQLFFSPLYNLKAGKDNSQLKVAMYPYYAVAAFDIKNTSGKSIVLNQIVLNSGVNEDFAVKGEIAPKAISSAKYVYSRNDDGEFVLPEDIEIDNEKTSGFWTSNFATNTTGSDAVVLSCVNGTLANGESAVAYMNVPVGKYTSLSVKVVFTTEEGDAKELTLDETKVVGISAQDLKHGVTKSIFGLTTDKRMKAYSITKSDVENALAAGHYISSKAEFLALLNSSHGDLEIYNMGNWSTDAEVAAAIELYSGANIKFINPVEINTDGACKLPSKVEFKKGVVIAGGNVTLENCTVSGTIEVKAGATLNLKTGTYRTVTIKNAGTLNMTSISQTGISAIESTGALTLCESKVCGVTTVKGGSVVLTKLADTAADTYQRVPAVTGVNKDNRISVEIAAGVTVTNVAADATVKYVTLTNNGTITTLADNKGTVINNGTIATVTSNAGTIQNYKNLNAVTANTGLIDVKARTAITKVNDTTNAGKVDNTLKSSVTVAAGGKQVVYYTYTGAVGVNELEALDTKKYAINKLVFNGANVTIDRDFDSSDVKKQLEIVNELEFKGASSLYVDVDNGIGVNIEKITISDNTEFGAFAGSGIGFKKNAEIVVKPGKTFTINTIILAALTGKKLTFTSEADSEDSTIVGKVVNNGTVQVGTSGTGYANGTHSWWTGAPANQTNH